MSASGSFEHPRARALDVGWVLVALVAAMAGCASSVPTRFHTLLPAATGAPGAGSAPDVRFDLAVTVPAQVDQPQIVLRLPDDTMTALEQDRWVAPLPDEIRGAVRQRIDLALSGLPTTTAAPVPPWRITLDVQRFDSMLGRAVRVQASWTLQPPSGSAPPLRCQAAIERRVGDSVASVTAGHRAAFEQLGDAISQALKTAASGGQPGCS
jgi:uncharacterized lipoprotein YmbA